MEVTHIGGSVVHQLVATLMDPEVNHVRHIARGIDSLILEPSRSPMLVEHRPSHLAQGSVFPVHHAALGRRIQTRELVFETQVMAKGFKMRVFKFRAIVIADYSYGISVPFAPQPQDKISNKTKRLPLLFQKRRPKHTESSRPPQIGRTTSHLQIARELGQQGPYGAALMDALSSHQRGRVRRGYRLGMPTRHTNQLFLKHQRWQSSDQIEFTQARQKVKPQVTQLPMPLPQLTRRTSKKATSHTRRLREIRSEHLILGNDHAN
jgi:hypothetical protein